jgi:hypothetical protein
MEGRQRQREANGPGLHRDQEPERHSETSATNPTGEASVSYGCSIGRIKDGYAWVENEALLLAREERGE